MSTIHRLTHKTPFSLENMHDILKCLPPSLASRQAAVWNALNAKSIGLISSQPEDYQIVAQITPQDLANEYDDPIHEARFKLLRLPAAAGVILLSGFEDDNLASVVLELFKNDKLSSGFIIFTTLYNPQAPATYSISELTPNHIS